MKANQYLIGLFGIAVLGVGLAFLIKGLALANPGLQLSSADQFSQAERKIIASMSLAKLPKLPKDPSNRYADNPQAAALGKQLFFDTRFSSNGKVACATCHVPEKAFTDAKPLAVGVKLGTRHSMGLIGTAYSPWLFWDGHKDSQWAQALAPLESSLEHNLDRTQVIHFINKYYRRDYEQLFGKLPETKNLPSKATPIKNVALQQAWNSINPNTQQRINTAFSNIGKSIAAYERTLLPQETRFDRFAKSLEKNDYELANQTLTINQQQGLRLFIGEAHCIECHSGPLLTNDAFHNTGVQARTNMTPDRGRAIGVTRVLQDEFSCLSPYSDAAAEDCSSVRFAVQGTPELEGRHHCPVHARRTIAQLKSCVRTLQPTFESSYWSIRNS